MFPTGAKMGENIARFQPVKMAAMEGQFRTQTGAPLAIIGMPDRTSGGLLDPIFVPGALSYLAYGSESATVRGLDDYPEAMRPPVEVVYYAYHIMVGLGTIFIGVLVLGGLLLWRGKLISQRWYLWLLMLSMPLPYIANEAGWTVAEVGRQPWIVYGVMRTADAASTNVSAGETVFTLLGFMGLYALLGLVFLYLLARILGEGPGGDGGHAYGDVDEVVPATGGGLKK
jgi:cytochrome d ubiquinol oxidase subunit I